MIVKTIHHRSSGPAENFTIRDTATLYDFVKMLSLHDNFDYISNNTKILYIYEEESKKRCTLLTDLQVKLSDIPGIENGCFHITITHNTWKSSPGYQDPAEYFANLNSST